MSRKTRKLMWSVPLIAAVAVVGALAAFMAVAPRGVFANPAPDGVTNFEVVPDGPTSIKLSWEAPDGGETPTGYRIDSSTETDGHKWDMLVSHQTELEYTHENLVPSDSDIDDGTYHVNRYYRVFAINRHGPGPESDIIQETTDGVSAPGAAEGLTATASGPTKIILRWEAPEDTGGLPITGYQINSGDAASTLTVLKANTGSSALTYTDTKLSADTTQYYTVQAINKVGASTAPSNIASDKTGKASRPSQPTRLLAVPGGDQPSNNVNLYWHAPDDDGGRPITEYVIQVSVNGGAWKSFTKTLDPTRATDGTVTNEDTDSDSFPTAATVAADYVHLGSEFEGTEDDITFANGMKLRYQIQAKHVDGTSRASAPSKQIILGDTVPPDAVPQDPDHADKGSPTQRGMPLPVEVTATGEPARIDLTWSHEIQTGYRIDVSKDGLIWELQQRNTGLTLELGSSTEHTYEHEDGIRAGDTRYYRVLANNGGIYGNAMNVGTDIAGDPLTPGAPTGISARAVNSGQIDLTWTAPEEDGGADIRRYLVEISSDGSTWPTSILDEAPALDDGMGTNTKGIGYVWIAKRDANDDVVTSYMHKGLPHDTRYYYRVRSDNSKDTATFLVETSGDDLATLTLETSALTGTDKTPKANKPAAPMSLSAHPSADSSLSGRDKRGVYLTWLAPANPAGAGIIEYEIERVIQDEDDFGDTVANDRTFYNDREELGDQMRTYRVRARNAAGSGAWSEVVVYPLADDHTHPPVVTELGTPSQPLPRVVTVGGIKTISILWDSGEGEERQIVQLLTEDRMFVDSQTVMPDGESADFDNDGSGIAPGTYRVQIVALGMGTDFRNSGTVLVTVE